jgi:2-desacetyl-2-hydroxyethyl bacteriochlorophyllide A dehydrogenase
VKAVVLQKPGQLRMLEVDPPEDPKPREASVLVKKVGICGTDFHAYRGTQPFFECPVILGHELGVEVVSVGENDLGLQVGARCAVEPYLHCGRCIACRRGKTNCCVNLKVLGVHIDGGMCERLTVPIAKLRQSYTLSFEQLALVEPLSIGAHAVRRAGPEPGEVILIIGAGPIGLAVAQSLIPLGVEVIVMDISDQRLEFCRNNLKLRHYIDGRSGPLRELGRFLGQDLPTIVFDCTGDKQSMQDAFNYVAHGGKLVFVGLFSGNLTFKDPDFHSREITLLSTRNATTEDFCRVIELMEAGEIDATPWISHRISARDFLDAFPQWADVDRGVLKAVVEW